LFIINAHLSPEVSSTILSKSSSIGLTFWAVVKSLNSNNVGFLKKLNITYLQFLSIFSTEKLNSLLSKFIVKVSPSFKLFSSYPGVVILVSTFTDVHDGNGNDVYALLKSSIIWASGSGWWNVLRTITGEQVKVSYFVSSGEEFHEPYWVEMTLWYVY